MRIFPAILLLAACGMGVAWVRAGEVDLENKMSSEVIRRKQEAEALSPLIAESVRLRQQGDYEDAFRKLEGAWRDFPEALKNTGVGKRALSEMVECRLAMAEDSAKNSQWNQVWESSGWILAHDPGNSEASDLFRQSDEILRRGAVKGESINPALSPRFFNRLNTVQEGLKSAQAYRETGQLDKAEENYEQVLSADPFNEVAMEGIRKIYHERSLVAESSRKLSVVEAQRQVRESFNAIYPKKDAAAGGARVDGPITTSISGGLEKKLKKIKLLTDLDFREASLDDIRRALVVYARDAEPNAKINFVVEAGIGTTQQVSLRLKKGIPISEVIRYVCQIAGVRTRLSENTVTFVPLVERSDDLIPQTFTVSRSFFGNTGVIGNDSAEPERRGRPAPEEKGGAGETRTEQARLMELGVKFPEGAFALYNGSTGQLKVVNTPEMLDLIGQLISAAQEETLMIRTTVRLIEINQADLDSITVNTTLGGSAAQVLSPLPISFTTNNAGPINSSLPGVQVQMNQMQGVGMLPNNTLQSFLQPNVLAGTNQPSNYALNTMSIDGTILNGMQYRTLITAISQKNSANVLASPSVVLKRGQSGKISVAQMFQYVTEYNDPQSSVTRFIPAGAASQGGIVTPIPGPETVLGSFPSQISDPQAIGVEMEVEPDVTPDNRRVSLKLKPRFQDFEGFINYGTIISSAYAFRYFGVEVPILTNNIQQPVFIVRELSLPPIEVSDGYTLLLGGLLREDIQSVDEKVPILGDFPVVGAAFRGKTQQAIKKNTLIFVTPRILGMDGQVLNPTAGEPTTAAAESPL